MSAAAKTESGVDALIARLRADGVAAGAAEADRIVAEAHAQAAQIKADAEADADALRRTAKRDADRYEAAGKEALNTAMRDAILTMKSHLLAQFETDVKRMTRDVTADPDMLKKMVLELVGRAGADTGDKTDAAVILPAQVVGSDAIRANADDIQNGALTKYVLGLARDMLVEGVTLHAADDLQAGIRAQIGKDDLMLDLSDDAIASLLMQHLQPRFRAVLEGVLR